MQPMEASNTPSPTISGRSEGVEALDQAFAAAMLANDAVAAASLYAADAVLFNTAGPPAVGVEAIRGALAGFLSAFEVTEFRHAESHHVTTDDLSAGWALFAITVTPRGGGPALQMAGRSTTVARKEGGHWRYLHDHASLPQA